MQNIEVKVNKNLESNFSVSETPNDKMPSFFSFLSMRCLAVRDHCNSGVKPLMYSSWSNGSKDSSQALPTVALPHSLPCHNSKKN